MKSLIASIILIITVIATTVGTSLFTSERLSQLEIEVEKIEICDRYDEANQKLSKIELAYKKSEVLYALILDDESSEKIELYILDLKSALETEDKDGALTAKSRLIAHIRQMRQLTGLNIYSVF